MHRRFRMLLVLLAVVTAPVLVACGDDGDSGEQSLGAEVYSANCATCHGPDGGGGIGPRLGGGAVAEAFPDVEDELAVIREGRGAMPAWEGNLSEEEIQAVAEYTREDLG